MNTLSVGFNKKVLTHTLSEPLSGATSARIDIHAGDGNLTIDRLIGGEQMLVSGITGSNSGAGNVSIITQ